MSSERRNLKAIIEWTETGSVVKTTETFSLPSRTSVELMLSVPLSPKAPGVIEEVSASISAYRCIDCDFETQSFEIMEEHQKSGKHSLWRRIKRFLGLFWGGPGTK